MKKKNLTFIILALIILSSLTVIAQPQISSISGSFNDGSTITITGSNFGSKSNPKPYLWADFESGSINPSSLGQMTSWNSIGGMAYTSNEGYGNTGGVKATDSSGSWAMSTTSNGFAWNDLNQKMYIFRKTKHNFIVNFNWKIWRMWPQTDNYPNVHLGMSALNVEQIDCPNGASNLGYFNLPSQQEAPENQWKTEELMYKVNSQLTSSDGEFYFNVNGKNFLTLPYYDYAQKSFCLKTSNTQQMIVNYIIHGVKANTVFPTDYRMWNDDVYLDTTWSRVMISSSPTWTTNSLKNLEIQIPTSWNTNSISIVVNTGTFSSGQTVYLYVINSTNGANTNGYPIVVGQTATPPADTTPPVISGESPTGALSAGTTSTTISFVTNEAATCRYSNNAGTSYSSMTNSFTTSTGSTHTLTVTGLNNGQTYNYYVRCSDANTNANANDYLITFSVSNPILDTSAPTQVTGLSANAVSTSQINLAWNAASDNVAVSGYRIYRNNVQVGISTTTSYSDIGLAANTTYQYKISAYDAANNNGPNSTIVTATTNSDVLPTQNNTNQTNQVIAKYAFEESTNQVTNLADNTIATLTNGPLVTSGKYGQGLQLDGVNDYLQLPQSYAAGKQEFTLMFWINPAKWEHADTIYDEWTNDVYWQYTVSPGAWVTRDTSTTTTGTRNNDLALPNLQPGSWHHIALTYSDSNNLKAVYLDGVLSSSATNSVDQLTSARDANARIGFASDGTYFQGIIDEVKIYSRALNQQEIIIEMNTPITNTTTQQNTPIEGDINNDGTVNIIDINSVVAYFGKTNGYPTGINLAVPSSIDLFDIMIIIRNWGRTQ